MAACVLALNCGCKKKTTPPPPPEVQFLTVTTTNVPIIEEWIGSLDGYVNAQIRAQVSGYLQTQNYVEGSEVKSNDLLFQIDPRPFQASVDQAKAKLAQDQAQAQKAELDVKRYTPLAKEQAISQEELDNAVQANLAAAAQVKADDALVENAQLQLGFTKITSPIDGIAGIALGQIGDLVSPSSGALTTVSTVNPIKVYFSVSEQSYLDFWRRYAISNEDATDLKMELVLSDGTIFPGKGKFYLADRQVNPTTGTMQIAAVFPNPQRLLRPGQYGRVRVQTETKTNAVIIPQRAVIELQGSYQIITVDDQNKTHLKSVKVGQQVGANWIIEEGLQAGDKVVIEGTQQVKEGTTVNPKQWNPNAQTNTPPDNGQSGATTNEPPKDKK
ncbi:MAG TPA: efflux RND transporter periplasmic adaptor subunit [Verrucomicrobiae bacterium]|nr:efflux RND transporter periplasmic adaptor subunit [Verrucomicrobiae bacterium]